MLARMLLVLLLSLLLLLLGEVMSSAWVGTKCTYNFTPQVYRQLLAKWFRVHSYWEMNAAGLKQKNTSLWQP